MEQLEELEVKRKELMVCNLKKSLYGPKQTPRQWYKKFDSFIENNVYMKSISDQCVFIKRFDIVGYDRTMVGKLKGSLSKSFATRDLRLSKQILGMSI